MSRACSLFKRYYSTCLLIFSMAILMGLVFNRETKLSQEVHPAFACFMIWFAVLWLSMVEGAQGALVGLAPVHFDLYKNTHPITYKSTSLAHEGDNLDRYLLGRQFMVVLIVFVTNLAGAPLEGATLWGFPDAVTDIFLVSGMAMILITTMIGQLNSQVIAAHCMLDYINNYFSLLTFYVAMAIEFSGLLHSSYLMQMLVSKLSGNPVESNEPPRGALRKVWFWGRCFLSLAILVFSFAVTLEALLRGQTTMWKGVSGDVAVVIFFILLSIVGLLEGMQIAFFAVTKLPKSDQSMSKFAKLSCDLLFKGRGHNLPGFMIGRQICVTLCFFVIARFTTINVVVGVDRNVFDVPDGVQRFFNTGLLSVILTTVIGSISWQLVASAFPIAFLSNPLVYVFLRICLLLESTGICSGAWVLASVIMRLAGFKGDEKYIGTAGERAKKNVADKESEVRLGPGRPRKLPGFVRAAPESLVQLMSEDPSVKLFVDSLRNIRDEGLFDEDEENQIKPDPKETPLTDDTAETK